MGSCCCGGGSDERERALISCAGCDPGLPCTVPQGYCRALTILFPILTSSVLPTTANGKWLCGKDVEKSLRKSRRQIAHRLHDFKLSCKFLETILPQDICDTLNKEMLHRHITEHKTSIFFFFVNMNWLVRNHCYKTELLMG